MPSRLAGTARPAKGRRNDRRMIWVKGVLCTGDGKQMSLWCDRLCDGCAPVPAARPFARLDAVALLHACIEVCHLHQGCKSHVSQALLHKMPAILGQGCLKACMKPSSH